MTKDVFVFVEQRDGVILPGGLQCITAAAESAGKTGGRVVAGLIGHNLGAVADQLDGTGAGAICTTDAEPLAMYNALKYTRALAAQIEKADPQIVLLAASFMGRDLAPRLAIRLGAGLATDCTEFDIDDAGALTVKRPIYAGKAFNAVHFNASKIQIASVRPNAYPVPAGGGDKAERIDVPFEVDTADDRQVTKEIARSGGG
ncbi:MAG: electron transfer flavoprotein subunit alpha/FixB family protein, partial [Planctomycetota bacterium]